MCVYMLCIYVYTYCVLAVLLHVYVYTYKYIYIRVYTYVYIYKCVYVCVYMYKHIYHTYTYIYCENGQVVRFSPVCQIGLTWTGNYPAR